MRRVFNKEIEGLWVAVTYEYEEGDKGDYYTPPTGPNVTIVDWSLTNGDCREAYLDYTDEEWDEWMSDIHRYVNNDVEWDIIEFEKDLNDEY